MEIKGLYSAYKFSSIENLGKPGHAARSAAAEGKNPCGGDTIKISRDAAFRSELSSGARKLASMEKTNAAASPEQLQRLKEKYANDRCPVSGDEIAEAILNRVLGSESKE